jgi:hypothetical protein
MYNTMHCTDLHCTALHSRPHCAVCTALHCTALHCTALHCTALHCTALHCTALHCTALHFALFLPWEGKNLLCAEGEKYYLASSWLSILPSASTSLQSAIVRGILSWRFQQHVVQLAWLNLVHLGHAYDKIKLCQTDMSKLKVLTAIKLIISPKKNSGWKIPKKCCILTVTWSLYYAGWLSIKGSK